MNRKLGVALAAAMVGLLLPVVARAEVKFCSDYPRTVFVAVAYQQGVGGWHATGWLSVPTGQCSTFNNPPLHLQHLIYRAETDDYMENGQKVREEWGEKGTRQFAVTDAGFDWDNAESLAGKPAGTHLAKFTDANVTAVDSDLDLTFQFKANGSTEFTLRAGGNN